MAVGKKISIRQGEVLASLARSEVLTRPRHTLELLEKKGFVSGDRRRGWRLTSEGRGWVMTRT